MNKETLQQIRRELGFDLAQAARAQDGDNGMMRSGQHPPVTTPVKSVPLPNPSTAR